jgi:formylglycine-generating enzyme required for sulfatase activity
VSCALAPSLVCAHDDASALAQEVERLVAALAADARADRLSAQEALLALPAAADALLEAAVSPPGFEPRTALDYVRTHRPRAPRPVVVPAGTYKVGSGAPVDQNPAHEVSLATFRIDDVEVTCFEWWRFVRASGTPPPPGWVGGRYRYGGESLPVGDVSPEEAEQFAKWTGGRLPTADEWEVAAHGGSPRAYPWGDDFEGHFNGMLLRRGLSIGEPPEVASVDDDRSPFGGFDFCGSLMEWVRLPDGRIAARGGYFTAGNRDFYRLTRAPDARLTRRRAVVGLRVVDRKK